MKAYNNSGQEVSSTPVILAANARRQIVVGDELPNPSGIGYIIFESDSENVCGYTKFYTQGKYRVAIPAVSDINAGDIYMSHIASNADWWTGVSLLNTTSSSKELTVEFDNGTTKPITIAAKEHQAFTINSLFGGVLQPNINSAVIKNGSGIVGLELFGSSDSSGDNYLSGILLKDDTTTHIYYPHIASNSTWWTGIVAYNPSATSCNLTITPFRDDGTSLTPQTIFLAGKEKYIGTVQSLNFPDGTAWFRIVATSPITGFELFGTNDGNQLGGYTGVGISGTNGVFAKIEKHGWTGIAFVNIENAPATVTMTAYDDSGNVIATESLNINAYEKVVDVASNLFSQDMSNASYIGYSSGGEVVGFQLNGSSDNMMLDALPGLFANDSNPDSPQPFSNIIEVGPGKTHADLSTIDWPNLKAGNEIRIYWRQEPYRSKIGLRSRGTADQPIRITGIANANGARPVISGINATTPISLNGFFEEEYTEGLGVIVIHAGDDDEWGYKPGYIQIEGLKIEGGYQEYQYTGMDGQLHNYFVGGGGIWAVLVE
ncbi:MAG: hypothetical protein SRB1_01320, partial [Desulfobacteraceae bacterium Eth-SRB1]